MTRACLLISLLPSATKLRRLCFYRCVSVHGGEDLLLEGAWSQGGFAPGGAWSWGGLLPGGVCYREGAWSGGVGIPAYTEADPSPRERRLLLRTVRILLECILVIYPNISISDFLQKSKTKTFTCYLMFVIHH